MPGSNGGVAGGEGIAQVPFRIDAPTTAAVRALARERGASVYVVLMAAFAVLAHRVSGADDLVIGTPIANRAAKGLDQVIGYVMNAVPTRWKVAPDRSFAELLAGFAVDFPDLMANADVPVGRIVSAAAPERSAGRAPLYQWVFMHLTQQPSVSVMKEFAEPERIHTGGEHDLVGVVKDSGDGMEGSFGLRTDVFSPGTVARWTQCYVELLKRITADPDAFIGDIDVVPSAMRGELLAGSAGPAAPAAVPLPELVTRQAARTPDAPAVESPGHTLSYAQLDDRVARLAGHLVSRGAGPGRIVALALARGSDWPVAALAVQRAAPPICRSTPPTRPSASAGSSPRPRRCSWSPNPVPHPGHRSADPGSRRGRLGRGAAAAGRTGTPRRRACHPHLRLHRRPQGRGGQPRRGGGAHPEPGGRPRTGRGQPGAPARAALLRHLGR